MVRVGFDWFVIDVIFDKFDEELDELWMEVVVEILSYEWIEDELGDVLFVVINLVWKLSVDLDVVFCCCNEKFWVCF